MVSQGIYFTEIDRNWSNLIIGIVLLLAVLMNNELPETGDAPLPEKDEVRT